METKHTPGPWISTRGLIQAAPRGPGAGDNMDAKTKLKNLYGKRATEALTRDSAAWAANIQCIEGRINEATLAHVETVVRAYAAAASLSLNTARRQAAGIIRTVGRVGDASSVRITLDLCMPAIGDVRGPVAILRASCRSLALSRPISYMVSRTRTTVDSRVYAEIEAPHKLLGSASAVAWRARTANGAMQAVINGRSPHKRWLATSTT